MYCTVIKHDGHSRTRSKCAFFSFFHWTVTLLLWEPKTCHPLQKHFKWQCKFAKKNSLRPKFTKAITIKQYLMRWVIGGNKRLHHMRDSVESSSPCGGFWLGGVHLRAQFSFLLKFCASFHLVGLFRRMAWCSRSNFVLEWLRTVRLCYKHVSKNSSRGENHRCSETQNS